MRQIFPKEIIENTVQNHRFKNSTKSKAVYTILLLSLAVAIALLPFIRVTVYSGAKGIIKPDRERLDVTVINSGKIVYSKMANNQKVAIGDTLLVMDNNGIDQQLDMLDYRVDKAKLFLTDLETLLGGKAVGAGNLVSAKYQKVHAQYLQQFQDLRAKLIWAKKDFERNSTLFKKEVISQADFEAKKFEYQQAVNAVEQLKKQQQNSLQADFTLEKTNLEEWQNNKERLTANKSNFVVIAPIDGSLLNVKGQEIGSSVSMGTKLAEISPDTDLLAECYVSPTDIGLIDRDKSVRFQVDAYNYNQWGWANGKIIEIGRDMVVMDGQPVFKVRCKLREKSLSLKNGFTGDLKKGMTLNANFELAQRTLFDLLYDKMDDWLNPNTE